LNFPATQTPATTSFTIQGTDGARTHTTSPQITIGNINQGLVDCWAMTDGSGSAFADSCGTSNTQTLFAGSLTWGTNAGLPGSTATFSSTAIAQGANNTATNFNGAQPFSVSAWIKLTAGNLTDNRTIISDLQTAAGNLYSGWELGIAGTAELNVYLISNFSTNNYINVHTAVNTLALNTLYYVVMTYDGSKTAAGVVIYVNGVAQTTTVVQNSLTGSTSSTANVTLGGRNTAAAPPNTIDGIQAYTRIYNRVLSQTDVTNYFPAGAR
jgi:hypothetical protein